MAAIAPAGTEPVEQIHHKAKDWAKIGKETCIKFLDDKNNKDLRLFGAYVHNKSNRAPTPDFVFGETLTKSDATEIRKVAKDLDIIEQKGDSK